MSDSSHTFSILHILQSLEAAGINGSMIRLNDSIPRHCYCSDVFTILQEIQRTWSYLEPLFIGSEEVKKELPEDAQRFEGIDKDVKGLLKSVSCQL